MWQLLLGLSLLLLSQQRTDADGVGSGPYSGVGCGNIFTGIGSPGVAVVTGADALFIRGPCNGNPACHWQCYQGPTITQYYPRCKGFHICTFVKYGSAATTAIAVSQTTTAITIRCYGDDRPAGYSTLSGAPLQYGLHPATDGFNPEGDSFTGETCYVDGDVILQSGKQVDFQTSTSDPAVATVQGFYCHYCTQMARNYHCSGRGIVKKGSAPCSGLDCTNGGQYFAYDSQAPVCTCDNQYVGYVNYQSQCAATVRATFCSGHGEAPEGTTYNAKVTAAGVQCVCDIGWAGTNCATQVFCPCGPSGSCAVGKRVCTCNADTDVAGNTYCCPVIAGRVCNGQGTCGVGGICTCNDGWQGIHPSTHRVACLPTPKGCIAGAINCPLCGSDAFTLDQFGVAQYEVLGNIDLSSGLCSCFGVGQQATFKQIAYQNDHGSCNTYCPHTAGATEVQCAGKGTCSELPIDGSPKLHKCVCQADANLGPGVVAYRVDSNTGLCCPAYPGTGQSADIGFPNADAPGRNGYVVCGARGTCSPIDGKCIWNAGRVDPYGCALGPGQTTVCNGQTCRVDGSCVCNTGTTNLGGVFCELNVACNPSDTAHECKSGGTCTTYSAAVTRIVNDLGFTDDANSVSTFGSVAINDQGITKLVKFLYTHFAGYNATHADFSKSTFWQTSKTLCEGTVPLSHSACLEAVVTQFSASTGVAQGRAHFTTDSAYIQDVLKRLFPTQSFPDNTWQTAFSVGLSAGATNAQRLQSIVAAMAYNRLYNWDTGTPPTFATSYSVLCNCTAPAPFTPTVPAISWDSSNTRVGRGGLQCAGTCPVGRDGQVCGGFVSGVHRGHCLATGKCECDLLFTGPSCTMQRDRCVNTSIVPNQLCNGRPDAQCVVNTAGTAMQCKCPPTWKGQFCELTACPVPTSPTYAQTLIECSGYGTCNPAGLTCTCDVSGQLAALGGSASLTNKPRLPYGSACEFDGIDSCGTFKETNPISHTGIWSVCNGHGVCSVSGACVCNGGFSGAKCTVQACAANCTATQSCNINTGQCICRTMWSGTNCTTNRCVHGTPTSDGTACTCDAFWSKDPSTGLCTIPYCAPTYIDSVLGTQKCTGSEPICVNSAQYRSPGGCCRAVCTQCKYNASISATPFCVCGNSLLQIQTDGICKDRCGGGTAVVINGVVDCDCTAVQNAIGPSRFIGNLATCGNITSCQNGGLASGQSCVCPTGFEGALCQRASCADFTYQGYYNDDLGRCVCNLPFREDPTTGKCSANWCNGIVYLAGSANQGRLVADSRISSLPSLVDDIFGFDFGSYFSSDPGQRVATGSKPSGFSCQCRDNEACVMPPLEMTFSLAGGHGNNVPGALDIINNEPCMACEIVDPAAYTNLVWNFPVLYPNNAVVDVLQVVTDCTTLLFPDKNGTFPEFVSGWPLQLSFVRNHTVWCNCSAVGQPHRTGPWCSDYLCENGGRLVKTTHVDGRCQCPWGTYHEWKLQTNFTPINLPYDDEHCICNARATAMSGHIFKQFCPVNYWGGKDWINPGEGTPWGAPVCGDGNQRCECPFAYGGVYCETLRCQHGRASSDRSRCLCDANWSGPLCSIGTPGTSTGVEQPASSTGAANVTASSSSSTAGNATAAAEEAGVGRPSTASSAVAVGVVAVGIVGAAAAIAAPAVTTASAVLASASAASTVLASASAASSAASTASTVLNITKHAVSTAQAVAPTASAPITATSAGNIAAAGLSWV